MQPANRAGALAALILLASCRAPESSRPPPAPDVTAYGAAIRVDPATLRLDGVVRIAVSVPDGAGGLALDLHESMRVRRVRLHGRAVDFSHRGDDLRIALIPGRHVVEVTYGGAAAGGLYAREAAGQRVVFTDSWPQRGAGWLPAVHHPSDPAALALAVEMPAAWEVVASGTAEGVTTLADGWRRWRFALAADAPSYTYAFAAADFAAVRDSAGRVPVTHYVLAGDSARTRGLARVGRALDTLSAMLGPYPYGAFATVGVPLGYDGMENAGAAFLRSGLYRTGPRLLEEVAFHEAVHQWMGNAVVPADWRELWLSEGLATYLTTILYERLDGPEAAREMRARMAALERDDAARALRPAALEHPQDALSPTVYGKGGAVLHLLRLTIGDEAFFAGLRSFARVPSATTDDLQRTMERASGHDLAPFFEYWVHGARVPVLRTSWDPRRRRSSWRVEDADAVLDGLPIELRVRQAGAERVVALGDAGVDMPGRGRPSIEPVGVVMRVED